METTVEKLEAMFLKAEADLDYIEKRLKLDFINSSAENGCPAEVGTLTESERESVALLSAVSRTTAECGQRTRSLFENDNTCSECEELTAAMLESLPPSVRSNIKLTDLNTFYQQLQQHLGKSNRGSLSVQKMKQLKMNVSDAKLKVLQHLSLVELDSKGHVRLVL
ncbi:spindle and kinetochore-associated protein 2 [Neolamprologus brichardi]|uniref:spindle and kinetochore-associated protein 2 n=1 Tax=Neolamprologus brichardi TaxID=32507 RepID=UPI001643A3DE|nr:spindle and kinetochore-associated protein 2 [Neolamprologus brichardi]